MGTDDTIIKALKDKGGRTQNTVEAVNNHLKSLKDSYDICTFSVKIANQIFKDVATLHAQDGAQIMLECIVSAVEYMGSKIPAQKLTTHLGVLGYEKLYQRLIQKFVDKEQFEFGERHANNLLRLLQQYQLDKNKSKKSDEGEFARKEKDTTDFCKVVANILLVKAQIARRTSADVGSLLEEVFEKYSYIDWVKGVGAEDLDGALGLYDNMFRHLFNWSASIRTDDSHPIGEAHLSCHIRALECLAQCCSLTKLKTPTPRVSFFDIACTIGSKFYERVSIAGASADILIQYHNKVHNLSRFLPVANTYEVEYIVWELWYASALFKREHYQEAKCVLDPLLAYGKSSKEPLVPLCKYAISVWTAVNYLRLHAASPSPQHHKAALAYLSSISNYTQSLPLLDLDAPPLSVPNTISKNPPPLAWSLLARAVKGLGEARAFYSKHLSPLRDGSLPPLKPFDTPEVSRTIERTMNALDELVDVGISWDKQLAARIPTHTAAFVTMCALQINVDLGSDCFLEKVLTCFSRALQISGQTSAQSSVLKWFIQLGKYLTNNGNTDAALIVARAAASAVNQLGSVIQPEVAQYVLNFLSASQQRTGDESGALETAEHAILTYKNLAESTPQILLERYVDTSLKITPQQSDDNPLLILLGRYKPALTATRCAELLFSLLLLYQQYQGSAYYQHVAIEGLLEVYADAKKYPIRRGRILVERAKLRLALIPVGDIGLEEATTSIEEAISLFKTTTLAKSADVDQEAYVKDEIAKAHVWLAACLLASDKTKKQELAVASLRHAMAFWTKILDGLEKPEKSEVYAENKMHFLSPETTIATLRIASDIAASIEDVFAQTHMLKIALLLAKYLCPSPEGVVEGYCNLVALYVGLGFTSKAEAMLKQTKELLATQRTVDAQPCLTTRRLRLLRLQLLINNGADVPKLVKNVEKAIQLQDVKSCQPRDRSLRLLLCSWLFRMRSSVANLQGVPAESISHALDAFNYMLAAVPLTAPQPEGSSIPSTQRCTSSSVPKWALLQHFMENVTQLGLQYAYQGQVREAHSVYEKGVQVAEQAGGEYTVYAGKLYFELGDLEYLRNHWVEARMLFQKARACFHACSAHSNSQLEAMVVMRLGDLYRRQGLLRRAVCLYESAIELASKETDDIDETEPVVLLQHKDATPREAKILGIFAKRTNAKGKDVTLDAMEIWRNECEDVDSDDGRVPGNSLIARITGKIARCELLRANYAQANKHITTALRKNKPTPVTKCVLLYHKGIIGLRMDDMEAGRKSLQEAFELCCVWNIPALTRRVSQALAISLTSPLDSTIALSMSLGIVARHRMCNLIAEYKRPKKQAATADESDSIDLVAGMEKLSLSAPPLFSSEIEQIFEATPHKAAEFKQMIDELPDSWVICNVCVSKDSPHLLISRMRTGSIPVVARILLSQLQKHEEDDWPEFPEEEGDNASSASEHSDDEASEKNDDAMEVDDDVDDSSGSEEEDKEESEDADEELYFEDSLHGTELERLLQRVARILHLSERTSKRKVDSEAWMKPRKLLDTKLQGVVHSLEDDILGWWKVLLLAPPQDKKLCAALCAAAGKIAEGLQSEEPEQKTTKTTRTTRATKTTKTPTATKTTKTTKKTVTPSVDLTLLELCLNGVPHLSDAQLSAALDFIVPDHDESLVEEVREAYVEAVKPFKKGTSKILLEWGKSLDRHTTILSLDNRLQRLPWETTPILEQQPVTRLPSVMFARMFAAQLSPSAPPNVLRDGVNHKQAFYVLDPENNLGNTQRRLQPEFDKRKGWKGITCAKPTPEQYSSALTGHDLFVYCGHGSGEMYLRSEAISRLARCGVVLLMGCSSGHLRDEGDFEPTGVILSYLLAQCPAAVGNLWDVTDRDLDKLTMALLKGWIDEGHSLAVALQRARQACVLKYLNGAAAVYYGVPVS